MQPSVPPINIVASQPPAQKNMKRHSSLRVSSEYGSQAYGINPSAPPVEIRQINSGPRDDSVWAVASSVGNTFVNGLDWGGEKLADVLGITTPRYASYIEEAELYAEHV
jgi:hypothetical protein